MSPTPTARCWSHATVADTDRFAEDGEISEVIRVAKTVHEVKSGMTYGMMYQPIAAWRLRPFFKNVRNLSSGQVLMTFSGRTQPRWAVATPYRMLSRWRVEWESVEIASRTPRS